MWKGDAMKRERNVMKTLLALLLSAIPALAVDGIVLNGTTKRPQPGVALTLVQPSQDGMNELGSAKSDAEGKFRIDKTIPPGPGLLQATYQGVTYNQIITPGMPTSGVEVRVFDATKDAKNAKAAEHLILIEPTADQIKVSETFVFLNESSTTFNDPDRGSARFFVPTGSVDNTKITITAPGGMPISRPPGKTKDASIYKVDYPIKPGETRIDVSYTAPAAQKFKGKIAASDFSTHIVTPPAVTLTGDGIEANGREPQTQANIYNVTGLDYNVLIDGVGTLRGDSGDQQQGGQKGEDTGQPKIEIVQARIYERMYLILGLAFGVLALGGLMLYRRGAA
jgi:hypothetical protein